MDREDLSHERNRVLEELERINVVLEPLLARREQLSRRASALAELLRPLDDLGSTYHDALQEAQWAARSPVRTHNLHEPTGSYSTPRGADILWNSVRDQGRQIRTVALEAKMLDESPADSSVDASVVIREILEEAGRPLHREEIYARSAKHPLGPVNRSTMVTKLSRDPSFMNVEGLPGYWAITSWPLRKRSKGAIVEAGRMYAERLTRLEREVAFLRHETVDVRVTEQRARRLALERQAEAAAGVQLDPAHHEMLNQRAEEAAAQLTRMMARIDRREAMIRSLWDAAADARDALGEEAAKYPDLPPRFRETSDRATQSAGSDASASYDQGTDAETKSEGGDE